METLGHYAQRSDEPPSEPLSEFPQMKLDVDLPLGSQVYSYLRELLRTERLKPGSAIQTGTLAQQIGISKTPLRDALIKLQTEGFLKILPQRGVVITSLDAQETTQLIQILGGLESKAMMLAFPHLTAAHVRRMTAINKQLFELIDSDLSAYRQYNELNIAFHDVFLDVCGNELMVKQIRTYKERLYHFPGRDLGLAWRQRNADEHHSLIRLIREGRAQEAADFMRDVHWDL
jgi:DNA-binding GntR family transcriptional regulator